MEKVEVNRLFITCHVCLEEVGVYQILPSLSEKIKYCFDIDIPTLDGPPKLICRDCKEKSAYYYTLKKVVTEKQKSLLTYRKNVDHEPSILPFKYSTNIVTVMKKAMKDNSHQNNGFNIQKKRITPDSDSNFHKMLPKHAQWGISSSWRKKYTKHFICRICSITCSKRRALIKHHAFYHTNMKKYAHIINSCCTVNLNKVDNRPNITGKRNLVALSKFKIVFNCLNNKYCVVYLSKEKYCDFETVSESE